MQKSSRFALLPLFGVSLLLPACSSNPTPAEAAPSFASNASKSAVETSSPLQTLPADYIASGPIVVEDQVELAAQRDGVVVQIMVETGTQVRKGQVLARLDDRQLTADRDAAAAKARSTAADLKNWEEGAKVAKMEHERSEALFNANVVPKQQEEKAKYQYEATEFEVDRQKEDVKYEEERLKSLDLELEKTRITAPFEGVVARRYLHVGQQVTKNDRLFWISAVAPLRVKFALPEAYLGRVRKGTELLVVASANSGEVHHARVVLVSPVVDPSSDTIDVTAELEGPFSTLRPGMTANIRLQSPR
jgi:membrane fusion protein (multidrug efflux system)